MCVHMLGERGREIENIVYSDSITQVNFLSETFKCKILRSKGSIELV